MCFILTPEMITYIQRANALKRDNPHLSRKEIAAIMEGLKS